MSPLAARLREVFRSEAAEDLAQLRSAFAAWRAALPLAPAESTEAVYRLAHKIKGACRAVSFQSGQTLGFLLEYLFRALHETPRILPDALETDALRTLDALADAVDAFLAGGDFTVDPTLVAAMNAHLEACGSSQRATVEAQPAPTPKGGPEVDPRLVASFRAEAEELLENLHRLVDSPKDFSPEAVNEALRSAHTLKGSAGVVKMRSVSEAAHRLEGILRAVEPGSPAGGLRDAAALIEAMESELGIHRSVAPSGATSVSEFFRVEQNRLKRVEDAFSELLEAAPDLESVGADSARILVELDTLVREEEVLRRNLASVIYRAPENQEYARMASYVNHMSRQIRSLRRALTRLDGHARRAHGLVAQRLQALDTGLHALQVTPAGEVLAGLDGMVSEIAEGLGKSIRLETSGFDIEMDRSTLQRLRGAIIHLIRNAIDHGIESAAERASAAKEVAGVLRISLALSGGRYVVEVADDGRGLSTREIRRHAIAARFLTEAEASAMEDAAIQQLIFNPRFSTSRGVTEVSGRGIGLSSVDETIRALGGELSVTTTAGRGTVFRMIVPAGRAGGTALMVKASGHSFGIPSRFVERVLQIPVADLLERGGTRQWTSPEGPVAARHLGEILGLRSDSVRAARTPAVMIRREGARDVILVDELTGLRQAVLRELPPAAAATGLFGGCIALDDGEAGLLLEVPAVLARGNARSFEGAPDDSAPVRDQAVILVVDDSYTSRTLEAGVIESMGYRVVQAADGVDGLRVLRNESVDLILSDIEMPRLDGFGFLVEVKKTERLRDIPFILISSIEDQNIVQKGLALGADSYIVKRFFEQEELKATIQHYL